MTRVAINETATIRTDSVSVTITAEPLVFEVPEDVAESPARAIALGIAKAIRAIGEMSRDGKHRMFNRTGRLTNELVAIASSAGYDVVAPLGYLEDDAVLERLIALVPAIADPTILAELQAAVERVATEMVRVGR